MSDITEQFKNGYMDITAETDDMNDDIELDVTKVKEFFYDSIWEMIEDEGEIEDRDLITEQAQAMIAAIDIESENLGCEEVVYEADRWSFAMDSHYTETVGVGYVHQARLHFKIKDDAPDDIKSRFDHTIAGVIADDFKENYDLGYNFEYDLKEMEYTNDDAPKPKFSPPPSLDNNPEPNTPSPPSPRR